MSLTLGEKLRQAREERGISVSEVAEQTRISPHYLDSIEKDDYRTLPGGIFNKGFVKSYAKYVGVDEQEALRDYSSLLAKQDGSSDDEPKTYKPEVLTDDRTSSSLIPTVIFAVIILGLMTWGLLTLVNYIQNQQSQPVANTAAANTNTPANSNLSGANTAPALPATNEISVEIKVTEDVAATAVVDGKTTYPTIKSDTPLNLKGLNSVKISYAKSKAGFVQMTLNGKAVTLPTQAAANQATIRLEIVKENLSQILQSGQIASGEANPAVNGNANRPQGR